MSKRLDIFIPTLNEAHRLRDCIESIRRQDLPLGVTPRISVIDAGSNDETREIAEELGVAVLDNSRLKDPEAAKMIGLDRADGDFLLFMDADMQCVGDSTFHALVTPMLRDDAIAAVFGRYVPRANDHALNRCLSMNPMQCDPVYQALVPRVPFASGAVRYRPEEIPPIAGTTMFRTALVKKSVPFIDRYFDVDVPVHLAISGHDIFWYAPEAEFFHGHITSFRDLIRKRLRNLDNGNGNGLLTIQRAARVYKWIDLRRYSNTSLVWRLMLAITGVGLFPTTFEMLIRTRDPAALLYPIMGPIVGATLLFGLIKSSSGRTFMRRAFSGKPL